MRDLDLGDGVSLLVLQKENSRHKINGIKELRRINNCRQSPSSKSLDC